MAFDDLDDVTRVLDGNPALKAPAVPTVQTVPTARKGTVQQIDETFRLEGESDRAVREQEARIADLDAQLAQAQAVRTGLDAQMAEYQREVQIRNECLAHPLEGIFYSWDCWRLSFQDVFANRWKALNNDIADNQRQLFGAALALGVFVKIAAFRRKTHAEGRRRQPRHVGKDVRVLDEGDRRCSTVILLDLVLGRCLRPIVGDGGGDSLCLAELVDLHHPGNDRAADRLPDEPARQAGRHGARFAC